MNTLKMAVCHARGGAYADWLVDTQGWQRTSKGAMTRVPAWIELRDPITGAHIGARPPDAPVDKLCQPGLI